MKIYVINLRRRLDRRARMEELLPPGLDVTFTSDWNGPLDGSAIDRQSLEGFSLFPWKMACNHYFWSRPLKKGEVGCSISHWRCWKDAASRNESHALIFEDDVVLPDPFWDKLGQAIGILDKKHKNWDLLYLGRRLLMRDFSVGDGLVRPGYSYGGWAYMLSRSGIEKVVSVGFEHDLIPLDEFLPALCILHPRPDVASRYPPILNAFALEKSIAFPLPRQQAGSDTEDTDFIDW